MDLTLATLTFILHSTITFFSSEMTSPLWREASSLILIKKMAQSVQGRDYQVLMALRSPQSSFMPNHCVFPGGVIDKKADFDKRLIGVNYLINEIFRWKFANFDKKVESSSRPLALKEKEDDDPQGLNRDIVFRLCALR